MAWILYFMPILYIIFITQKLGASDQNGLQIRILHRIIHRLKEKKTSFFYTTLKLKNSEISFQLSFCTLKYFMVKSCVIRIYYFMVPVSYILK